MIVLAIFILITTNLDPDISPKTLCLLQVPCIQYIVELRKSQPIIQVLINSNSNVNTITPVYAAK